MTDAKPPNLRDAVICRQCRHFNKAGLHMDGTYQCMKYKTRVYPAQLCDDWEER